MRLRSLKIMPIVASALVAALLSGCATDEKNDSGQGSVKVKLASLAPTSSPWTYHVAEAKGFFAKHGVEVEVIQTQNSSSLAQAVASGSADAGMTQSDNVLTAIDKGAPLVITGAFMNKPWLRLFGAPGINDVSDLRGKTVSAGSVSGGTGDLLTYMLEKKGLAKGSYNFLAITNSSDRVVGLTNGQIQAGFLTPPYDGLALKEGAKLLDWYSEPFATYTLTLNKDWATRNPAAAKGLTKAFSEAAAWTVDPANRAEVESIVQKATNQTPEDVRAGYDFLVGEKVLSADLRMPDQGLENVARISAEVNGRPFSGFDLARYYDGSYLEP